MTAKLRARQHSEWQARQARRQRLMIAGWVALGLVFVGVLVYLVWKEVNPAPLPGREIPIQGAEHVPVGVPHEPYNSEPPTSGPHYDVPAEAGFYDIAPPDEQLVHNMEHGHVIIWYNCSDLSDADCNRLKDQIRDTMSRAGTSRMTGTLKLVAVPRTTLDVRLALTAWGRLDELQEFDRERILAFVRAFRDRAPEPFAP
jgi:hypothetical protein